MKKAVVFDLDGTLLDTLYDLYEAVNFAMRENGFPEWSLSDVRRFVGNGMRILIERCLPDGKYNDKYDKAFSDFKKYYSKHLCDHTKPYDGIIKSLEKLQNDGFKIALVSNKSDDSVKELSKKYFGDLVQFPYGEKESAGIRKKPFPDSTLAALEKMNVSKDEAVFVGDSDVDYETAKNAGLDVILVTWGFRDKEELMKTGQKLFCDNPGEIYDVIKKM